VLVALAFRNLALLPAPSKHFGITNGNTFCLQRKRILVAVWQTPLTPDPSFRHGAQQIWRDWFDIYVSGNPSPFLFLVLLLLAEQTRLSTDRICRQATTTAQCNLATSAGGGRHMAGRLPPPHQPKDPFNAPLINEPLSRRTRPIIKTTSRARLTNVDCMGRLYRTDHIGNIWSRWSLPSVRRQRAPPTHKKLFYGA